MHGARATSTSWALRTASDGRVGHGAGLETAFKVEPSPRRSRVPGTAAAHPAVIHAAWVGRARSSLCMAGMTSGSTTPAEAALPCFRPAFLVPGDIRLPQGRERATDYRRHPAGVSWRASRPCAMTSNSSCAPRTCPVQATGIEPRTRRWRPECHPPPRCGGV